MEFIKLHPVARDLTGQRFGRLFALGPIAVKRFKSGANHSQWLCQCDCGAEKVVSIAKLPNGNTKSCGCLRKELAANNQSGVTHGMHSSPEYDVWHSMLGRCRNKNDKGYPSYGGRGIKVCDRWKAFENFFADVGPRPSAEHSIDRYPNNDGDYEPGNVRWATASQQQRNMRTNRVITAFGRTEPLVAFIPQGPNSREYNCVRQRLVRGWSPEAALTQKSRRYG